MKSPFIDPNPIKVTRPKPPRAARKAVVPIAPPVVTPEPDIQRIPRAIYSMRNNAANVAGPMVICNSNTSGSYSYEKTLHPPRPGADDGLKKASRIGDHLLTREGCMTDLSGNPITPGAHHHD